MLLSSIFFWLLYSVDGFVILDTAVAEAVVGSRLVLHCRTCTRDTLNPVEWHFKADDNSKFITLYLNGHITNGKQGISVTVNVSSGCDDLIIFDVALENAGTYTCIDGNSVYTVEVVVFEQYPSDESCSLTVSSDFVIGAYHCGLEPGLIQMSCKLRFKGNLAVNLKWLNGDQIIQSSNSSVNDTILSTIQLRTDRLQSSAVLCLISYRGNWSSKFNWTVAVNVKLMAKVTTGNRTDCNVRLDYCNPFDNFLCDTYWIDGGNFVANESVLQVTDIPDGNYSCVASCMKRNQSCLPVTEQIIHRCDSNQMEITISKLIGIVASISFSSLVAVLGLVKIYSLLKARKNLNGTTESNRRMTLCEHRMKPIGSTISSPTLKNIL